MVESSLNIHGDEILYVGDHIYTDVSQSKVHLRWRTALICRELEEEVRTVTLTLNIVSLVGIKKNVNLHVLELRYF